MGRVIVITSGKGGSGKTSVSAGLSCCLASLGHRVVCLDADVGLRNLDVVLGLSDRAPLDFCDVILGAAELDSALVNHPQLKTLWMLAAPAVPPAEQIDHRRMGELVNKLRERFDYTIIDSPGGLGRGFALAAAFADEALVVTTPDAVSLRDSQRTAELLDRMHIPARLIVNRVRPKLIAARGMFNIDDSMDLTGLPLLGVIPEDETVIMSQNRGIPVIFEEHTGAALAYMNITHRIEGHYVPIMKVKEL